MPMPSNRAGGVSVSIRLDIYRDGHGCLVCTEMPDLSHPVKDHTEMEEALRRLWDRGMREGVRRSYFKT
jgi:hypothetical protein